MGASGGNLQISARNRKYAGDRQGADLSRTLLQSFDLDKLQGVAAARLTVRADIAAQETLLWESFSQVELGEENLVASLGFLRIQGLNLAATA